MVFFHGERYQGVIVQLSVREQVRRSNLRVFGKFEDAKHSKDSNEDERAALLRSLTVASNVLQHPFTESVTLIPSSFTRHNRLSNRLNNRLDNRLNVCLHDATDCSTGRMNTACLIHATHHPNGWTNYANEPS